MRPNEHLKDYIKCYWVFEKEYKPGDLEHIMPDSSYELVNTGQPMYAFSGEQLSELFMIGQLQKPLDLEATGAVRQWCVRFFPWGLLPFGDVTHIADKAWAEAKKIFDEEAYKVFRSIPYSDDTQALVNRLDDFFVQRLLDWQFDDSFLKRASQRLRAEKGSVKVSELAQYCYLSRRQLIRNVKQATGRSPHEVTSRIRFEGVRDAIMHNPDVPLAHLAAEYSYSDQSHLIKEFKHYTNMTPSEYATIFRQAQPHMQDHQNVTFLQFP